MNRIIVALWALGSLALAALPDWYYANLDTFPRLPTSKLFYLEQKAGLTPRPKDDGESLNVRLLGKWGGGPSWGVTGKDTLVYLSRGSEVVVINFADTAHPQILNYIQAKRLAGRPVLVDTLLYLVTSGYIEVFNVSNPTNAPRVGRLATPVSDIDVEDTLLYSISADTFRVFSFADPANPRLLGACADSGYALDYDGGYAYLRDRWGMYILDVRDPAHPHRIASWGTDIAGVKVRGNHCYVAQGSMGSGNLYVLNVSNPASPWQEGVLSGTTGEDVYLVDTLLFLPGFDVVNVTDSSRPWLVGHANVGGLGVWVGSALPRGYVAKDQYGLTVLSLTDIAHPAVDTEMLAMGDGAGISVRNGIACVASQSGTGLTLLDVSDPSNMRELANLDTAGGAPWSGAVVNCESIAYIGWAAGPSKELLRVVDITDPLAPHFVGGDSGFNPIEAMALRDTFIYCAEEYKFEVFNVANPRRPVWRGRCDAYSSALGIDVQGTLAYVAPRLQIFDVADPSNPMRIHEESGNRVNGRGIAVRDTIAYFLSNYDTLWVYGVSNPYIPVIVGWVPSGSHRGFDLVLRDSYAYAGCQDFRVYDVSSAAEPTSIGYYATPYYAMGLDLGSQYVYVACYLAGVEILELLPVGLAEPGERLRCPTGASLSLSPNPVGDYARLSWSGPEVLKRITVRNAAGRTVLMKTVEPAAERRQERLGLSHIRPGVYFVEVDLGKKTASAKLVKR